MGNRYDEAVRLMHESITENGVRLLGRALTAEELARLDRIESLLVLEAMDNRLRAGMRRAVWIGRLCFAVVIAGTAAFSIYINDRRAAGHMTEDEAVRIVLTVSGAAVALAAVTLLASLPWAIRERRRRRAR